MSPGWRAAFWLIGTAVFIALLYLLSPILLPFVAGMGVAYFLDPVADRIERWGAPRWLAATILTVAFVLIVVAALVIVVPLLQSQIASFLERLPQYLDLARQRLQDVLPSVKSRLSEEDIASLRDTAGSLAKNASAWIGAALGGLVTGGLALLNLLSLMLITPVVAFYLLRDWDRIVERVDECLPRRGAATIRALAREIDDRLSGFVRGQAIVCLILGVFYATALTTAGLDFGLIVGLAAGAVTFIPYFGAVIGLLLSVGIALAQFDAWQDVAIIAAIFFVGQALEGNVITPKLVGERVGLHPVWMIFALLAGGTLFGFVGVLLAVPMAAAAGVLVRYAVNRYMASPVYDDPDAPTPQDPLPPPAAP
ncbi:MAG: AI-2E family transporter [Rhodospirillaceae bacterium]